MGLEVYCRAIGAWKFETAIQDSDEVLDYVRDLGDMDYREKGCDLL